CLGVNGDGRAIDNLLKAGPAWTMLNQVCQWQQIICHDACFVFLFSFPRDDGCQMNYVCDRVWQSSPQAFIAQVAIESLDVLTLPVALSSFASDDDDLAVLNILSEKGNHSGA